MGWSGTVLWKDLEGSHGTVVHDGSWINQLMG
jgi:hypothetical protein